MKWHINCTKTMKIPILLMVIMLTAIGKTYGEDIIYAPVGYQTDIVTQQYPQLAIKLTYDYGNTYNGVLYPDQYLIRQSDLTGEMTQVTDVMMSESYYYTQTERTCKSSFGLSIPLE